LRTGGRAGLGRCGRVRWRVRRAGPGLVGGSGFLAVAGFVLDARPEAWAGIVGERHVGRHAAAAVFALEARLAVHEVAAGLLARLPVAHRSADLALVDPRGSRTTRAKDSESIQVCTPFEGIELSANVEPTFPRSKLVYENGNAVGKSSGRYL